MDVSDVFEETPRMVRQYKSYKFRLYPNRTQEEAIQKTFGCVRYVYNHFLEDRIRSYQQSGKWRTYFQQSKSLTTLKQEKEWLKDPDKNALRCALQNLDAAYQNFFRRRKCGTGFPKFKSKKNNQKSYSTVSDRNNIRIEGCGVRLPKIGMVKAKISRQMPKGYRIIAATVSQNASGKYFVSISMEYESEIHEKEIETALGLDYSSPHFYVDSEGNEADMPHFYREAEKILAREQRKLSKMVKGSNNYRKQRVRLARAYEKVRNCREDWQHKESTRLADAYDLIAVEDINYQDMARGLKLAKATNDNGFGQFRSFLAYKLAERGKKLVTIDKWFPSSKLCRFCGAVNSELTLKDREWDCPSCGAHLQRDVNAAINIKTEGIRYVTG